MQTRDQHGKRPRDWKVIAAVATASALGISGLALAGPTDGSDPDPINLRDRTSITEVTTSSVPATFAGLFDVSADSSLDSPFDDASSVSVSSLSADSPDAPPPTVVSAASVDSPDSPPPPPPPASADSASADSDSPDSPDSVDSASSFDDSADS